MKIEVHYDTNTNVPDYITTFMHCMKCLEELPVGVSPRDWVRTSIGITKKGHFQVWCNRHNINVAHIELKLNEGKNGKEK